jgi:hypothetical protein
MRVRKVLIAGCPQSNVTVGGIGGVSGRRPQRQNSVVQGQGLVRRYRFIFVQLGSGGVTHSWVAGGVEAVGSEAVSESLDQSMGR